MPACRQAKCRREFVHSLVDQMVKRCLEVPSRITVVREEHFVSPKARPSFPLSSPEFRTDSLRCSYACCLASGATRYSLPPVWTCNKQLRNVCARHASDQALHSAVRREPRRDAAAALPGRARQETLTQSRRQGRQERPDRCTVPRVLRQKGWTWEICL